MPHSHARRLGYVHAARSAGRRWLSYLTILGTTATAILAISIFPAVPMRQGYAGVVLGAVGMLVAVSLVGLNNPALDGRLAEQWTLDGLRKVRGWRIVDNVPFEREDVDHVVVAPSGVLAVETQYRDSQVETARHRRDLAAARRAARKIALFLQAEKLRDITTVVPVLVVWGPGAPSLPEGHRVDGDVHVVDGDHPELWMHLFNAPRLSVAVRADVFRRFETYVAKRADHDAKALPSLRSEMWREFRGGIVHERATRAARRERARALRRRHGLRLVPPPAPVAPMAAATGVAEAGA